MGIVSYVGSGIHTIINDYGSQSLRSADTSATNGYNIQWIPTSTPAIFEASYLHRMESFTANPGTINHQLLFVSTATTDESVYLQWREDGSLSLLASTPTSPSFTWATQNDLQSALQDQLYDRYYESLGG